MADARPEFEALEGELRDDGWTTRRLALRFPKATSARVLKFAVRNPGFNEAYLRNTVRLSLDGAEVFNDMLFAGGGVQIEQQLPAGEELLLELDTEAYLVPDALDQRERGVILKLSQAAGS